MSWLPPPLPPTFAAALRDVHARKLESKVAAAERLGAVGADEDRDAALDGLLALTEDVHSGVRAAALRGLAELQAPRATTQLQRCLTDSDALVRELALIALGELEEPQARAAVREAVGSPHPELRFQAIAALAQAHDAHALPLAVDALRDPDAKVRASAARALGEFGIAAQVALRAALEDPAAAVRGEAAIALARLGDGSGAIALRDALDAPELAFEALEAIADLQLEQLREPAAAIAQSVLRPLLFKAAAARALIRLHDPRGVAVLARVLRAFRSGARSYAVRVVGELGVDELTGELLRLTQRSRGTDPEALVEALAQLLPRNEGARAGLERLASRSDHAGAQARRVLEQTSALVSS